MLRLMRDHAGSWLIKIILGAIVIVFVFWGVGNFQSQRSARIATVNGEPITIEEYRKSYNNLIEQYRQRFGGNLDENMLKMMNVKKMALDQLIDQALLRQEAGKLRFRVSDAELAKSIMDIPAFQNGGTYDNQLYNRVLRLNRMTAEEFEAVQRESMLTQKMRSFVLDAAKISEAEAQEWYQWNNASADIEYVLFDPEKYTDIALSDEDIQKYYESRKESYKTEEKISTRYLEFRYADYSAKVTVPDADIESYFQTHPNEFKEEKSVEARHILFRLEKNATDEEAEKKRQKAEEVMKMAKEGKDFAELAKGYSEDPAKDNGGHLGTFKKESMVKPFSDKAFSMAAGEISEPVRTQFGWHIIKVEKINEASEKKLEEVKEDIRKKLTDENAKVMAYDEAQNLYDAAYEGSDLKLLAEDRKKELMESGFFTRDKGPEKIKNSPQFAATAFGLSDQQLSEVTDLGDACYIIQIKEKIPSAVSPFEDVKEKVRADLLKIKQEEKAKLDAENFLAELKSESDKNAPAKETENSGSENAEKKSADGSKGNDASADNPVQASASGGTPKSDAEDTAVSEKKGDKPAFAATGFFKRNAAIPEIGYEQEISKAAFGLSKETPLTEAPLKGKKGYYVIRFKDRKLPEAQDFEKEKKSVEDRLLRQKQYKIFGDWMAQIKGRSEIIIEEELLN